MSKCIWQYSEDFGRDGHLEGIFVATEEEMQAAANTSVRLGEVLGKHSDVYANINNKTCHLVTSDRDLVASFLEMDMTTGINPLEHGYTNHSRSDS